MSLSQNPVFAYLKTYFVCGYKDITNESYSGVSGVHMPNGNSIDTTNGAGPHNLQIFFLAADGTVLHCMPGFWHSQDIVEEMQLAAQLNKVWVDPKLSRAQKDAWFRQMQLAHIQEHPEQMVARSKMQWFDAQYEAQNRLATTDTIKPEYAEYLAEGRKPTPDYFKTTDVIMHERMANRPFVQYNHFDVAAFSDYGKQKYDKQEDMRDAETGRIASRVPMRDQPELGNEQAKLKAHPERVRQMQRMAMLEQQRKERESVRAMQSQQRYQQTSYNTAWGNGPQWGR